MNISLEQQIEAILYFRGEAVSLKKLAEYTSQSEEEVSLAVDQLELKLGGRGIIVVRTNDEVMLGTSPEASEVIEKITKEELSRDLGKAGLETLSIILYKGSANKREIDYIRGVNSGFILRNLLIRGLVSRDEKKGERGFVYSPTTDLLSYMGIGSIAGLPEYESVKKELNIFLSTPQDNSELNQ